MAQPKKRRLGRTQRRVVIRTKFPTTKEVITALRDVGTINAHEAARLSQKHLGQPL